MSDVRCQMSAKKPLASLATGIWHLASGIYSCRIAITGSTFIALRAGI
jgi:hypothetical protein